MEISANFLTVLRIFPGLQGVSGASYEKLAASMMNMGMERWPPGVRHFRPSYSALVTRPAGNKGRPQILDFCVYPLKEWTVSGVRPAEDLASQGPTRNQTPDFSAMLSAHGHGQSPGASKLS